MLEALKNGILCAASMATGMSVHYLGVIVAIDSVTVPPPWVLWTFGIGGIMFYALGLWYAAMAWGAMFRNTKLS